jgi:predicted nuclease of predicted toxin-antitoxin system
MMRILADENFPGLSVQELRRLGHDVLWVRTDMPGISDSAVLTLAQDERRLLVTLDKDFGEFTFRLKQPAMYGVILFRMKMTDPRIASVKMANIIESRSDWVGHFSVVEDDRIRMRPLSGNSTVWN